MKRRLVKKWIKRYLKPLVDNLPVTASGAVKIESGDGSFRVLDKNWSIKNGYVIPEGCIIPHNENVRHRIIRTGDTIRRIVEEHDEVYLRVYPEIRKGGRVYCRLITGVNICNT